ncbi:MAG: PPC domain-containing protein [Promethearchaeota archaeon]|jgi:hypothetical protein
MKFHKNKKLGVSILFLLLIFTASFSLINLNKKDNTFDENSLSLSAPDDPYEPNDDFWSGAFIIPNYYPNLKIIESNEDWFNIFLNPGDKIDIYIYFNHFEGDLELEIWDPFNSWRNGTYSSTDNEFLSYASDSSGDWRIRVYHALGNTNVTYDLDIWVFPGDDPYEENDDWWNAYDITGNEYMSHNGIQADDDWYQVYTNPADERLHVDVYYDQFEGDINFTIFSYNGVDLDYVDVTDDTCLDVDATFSDLYYILIYGENAGNTYDLRWEAYAPDDAYEDYDDFSNAYYLSSDEDRWLSTLYGKGVQNDEDWYEIYINPGETRLIVFLTFWHWEGNINLEIKNSINVSVINSNSWDDNEFIDFILPSSGTYYLRVYGDNNGNEYDLLWSSISPSVTDDLYEINNPNPNISPPQATWLSSMNGLGIQGDEDWYEVRLDSGEDRLFIELIYDSMQGNVGIEIYNLGYTYLGGSDTPWDNEIVDIFLTSDEDYLIKIYGDDVGNVYDLWWEDLSSDDWAEENDDYWSSRWVDPNYHSGLRIVGYDEDWFHLYLNPGDILDVSIYFDHFEGDLELELYDPYDEFNPRLGSYSSNNDEYITYTADVSGDWRIRVFHAFGDSDVYYDLDIWLNGGGAKSDDPYEENDWSGEAYDLTSYDGWWLTSIMGEGRQFDEDWYKIDLQSGSEKLIVEINFDDWEGNLGIELFNNFNDVLAWSDTRDNHEYIEIENPPGGTYYIRVYGEGRGNWYDMYWSTSGQISFGDDPYEYNNEPKDGFWLADNEGHWLTEIDGHAVQGDEDWYTIDVTPGFAHLVIELQFNHSHGNIDMELYHFYEDSTGKNLDFIALSASFNDSEYFNLNVTWGIYLIKVYGEDMGNEYDLWWDDYRTDFRPDDWYEENDNPFTAYDLSANSRKPLWRESGMGLQYDEDWYQIFINNTHLQLKVLLIYDHNEGVMGLEIYDEDLKKVTGNFTLRDHDFIDYRLRSNGTYYIKIFGDNSGNTYSLIWTAEEEELFEAIPGYDLLILIISIFGIAAISIKIKRSKIKHK